MEKKLSVVFEGVTYTIAPSRFSIADVEEEYEFSFLKPKTDSFSDAFRYATMMVLAGIKEAHPDADYELARKVANAIFDEYGFKEGSEALGIVLKEAINPTTGAKKTATKR